jgi:hypothetical protein
VPVAKNFPGAIQMVEAKEIITVDDGDFVTSQGQGLNGLNSLCILNYIRKWLVFRGDHAVHDEVVIIRDISKISTVPHVLFTIFSLCSQALRRNSRVSTPLGQDRSPSAHMVGPLPDKSTHKPGVLVKSLDIFFCSAAAISHGM